MTKEELEIEKLKEEIRQLKIPFWKSPSYITIFLSVLFAVGGYVSTTNSEQKRQIENLKAQQESLKEIHQQQVIELTANQNQLREESLRWESAASANKLQAYKRAVTEVNEVVYKNYTEGYVAGVLESFSGQAALQRTASNPTPEAVGEIIQNILKQTLKKTEQDRINRMEEILKKFQ